MNTATATSEAAFDDRLLLGYLQRRVEILENVIYDAPVFRKRYNDAVDELEEVEELREKVEARIACTRRSR